MQLLPGPDFPTGATHLRADGHQGSVHDRPRPGRGPRQVRDSRSSRTAGTQIIFSEIPYQLTKEMLLKKLAELVNDGRVTGVSSIDDFSDRKQPVRIAVTVKKGEDPNVVVNQLFEYSPLQDTFSMIMLALVNGRPRTCRC